MLLSREGMCNVEHKVLILRNAHRLHNKQGTVIEHFATVCMRTLHHCVYEDTTPLCV